MTTETREIIRIACERAGMPVESIRQNDSRNGYTVYMPPGKYWRRKHKGTLRNKEKRRRLYREHLEWIGTGMVNVGSPQAQLYEQVVPQVTFEPKTPDMLIYEPEIYDCRPRVRGCNDDE